jgi:hypothetical protein
MTPLPVSGAEMTPVPSVLADANREDRRKDPIDISTVAPISERLHVDREDRRDAVERAAWGIDHNLACWIAVDLLSEYTARPSGAHSEFLVATATAAIFAPRRSLSARRLQKSSGDSCESLKSLLPTGSRLTAIGGGRRKLGRLVAKL